MTTEMAQTRKPAASPRSPKGKAPTPAPTRADGRSKSLLSIEGERASLEARRAMLLRVLKECDWNLSATAEKLQITNASTVIRAIRDVGLEAEYEAAKKTGRIRPGPRAE